MAAKGVNSSLLWFSKGGEEEWRADEGERERVVVFS